MITMLALQWLTALTAILCAATRVPGLGIRDSVKGNLKASNAYLLVGLAFGAATIGLAVVS